MQYTRKEIIADFELYCRYMLPTAMKGKILPFRKLMMQDINRAVNGTGPRKLMFSMPPRHWKTYVSRNLFLTYMFGRFPDKTGVYATYNEDFVKTAKDEVAVILASEEYKWLFPNAKTRSTVDDLDEIDKTIRKTKKDTYFQINNIEGAGKLIFVGRGSGLTGKGVHYRVLDDPYKDQSAAESEVVGAAIMDWYNKVWKTRAEPGCISIICYTRWVSDDIAGKEMKDAEENTDRNFKPYLVRCFHAEKDNCCLDPHNDEYDKRKIGELLDPERVEEYADAKKDESTWMAMYQQTPLDVQGLLFKMEMFGRYNVPLRGGINTVISVDANYSDTSKTIDTTGITVWEKIQNKYYLRKIINRKMNYPDLKLAMHNLMLEYPNYWAIIIEDTALGGPLLQEMSGVFTRVIGVKPHGKSKRERAQFILPVANSGGIMLPSAEVCPNIGEFMSEISRFTGINKREKDDLVDSMVMAITYYEQYGPMCGETISLPVKKAINYDFRNTVGGGSSWLQRNRIANRR